MKQLRENMDIIIIGQSKLKEAFLWAVLSDDHILIEAQPGTGKTLAVKAFARCIDAPYSRIQFTPDATPTELLRIYEETEDPNQFLKSLKIDFFKDRIFVFTPKGAEIDLPREATALDFAFHIRPDLAMKSKRAKVNSVLVSLDYQLQNGEVVEIIPSQRGTILNRSWLNFVRTNLASTKIKEVLKSATPQQNLRMGRFQVQKELLRFKNIKLKDLLTNKKTRLLKTLKFDDLGNLFIEVGKGNLEARNIIETLFGPEELLKSPYTLKTTAFDRVGLLKDISQAISKLGLNVLDLKAERPQNKKASLRISLEIPNVDKLYLLFSELKKVKGMLRVEKVG